MLFAHEINLGIFLPFGVSVCLGFLIKYLIYVSTPISIHYLPPRILSFIHKELFENIATLPSLNMHSLYLLLLGALPLTFTAPVEVWPIPALEYIS